MTAQKHRRQLSQIRRRQNKRQGLHYNDFAAQIRDAESASRKTTPKNRERRAKCEGWVSNRTETFYFANNNARHFSFNADERFLPVYQFADPDNKKITHLDDFAKEFLAKCTLGQMISKYMVLIASEQKLLMMRPYQIYAVKNIVRQIDDNSGNGYVWHTTGSGKTLTSFKASTLLKSNPNIEKCVFVVDRKDLDRQTREEFNRFQEGCVEANTNTGSLVRRLISDDYADKVIVCTVQKLGLALDENSKRNKGREKKGLDTYREMLEPLRDKRMVFIFDECHRSQFGENHQAIKSFFPKAQLFGFTGTPIFDENATQKQARKADGDQDQQMLKTTKDLFQNALHKYTITHAIEDGNVLRFHVDYYKFPDGTPIKPGETLAKRAVVDAILEKHHAATGGRKFNAILATSSINDAIEYYALFDSLQNGRKLTDPDYRALSIAAVFSPPAKALADDPNNPNPDAAADVRQIQEDLAAENEDNKVDPDQKKKALEAIIADYNARYGTNHTIYEFDLYYQDVQTRIKDQQYPNEDMPKKGAEKIDITIVVDMLLTGFDSKYLNTLYVDKNLKHHGLIQAFSRTNRVLNATKPFGHILDFRGQQQNVNDAVEMFSGLKPERAREIWLVDKAPKVIEKLKTAVQKLDAFMKSHGLDNRPEAVANLKGDEARAAFVKQFKEVQRLQTQLDQFTDLTEEEKQTIEAVLPSDELKSFRSAYLATAQRLREQQKKTGDDKAPDPELDDLDFEFVLFASALIDYDYIVNLMSRFTQQDPKKKLKITRDALVAMIASEAKFIDERELITEYVQTLEVGKPLTESAVRDGYAAFKAEKNAAEIKNLAAAHGLPVASLQAFVDAILQRMIFDGEQLTELMEPLGLAWRDRRERELKLMEQLLPLLNRRAAGREIAGLKAYEE